MDLTETAKKNAAIAAVNEFIKHGQVVGIGSGSTIVFAVQRIAERVKEEKLDIVCIPTSFQSTQLILEHGLKLGDLSRYPTIDVDIDGADEVDENLNLIKGGGGCHLQEKIIAYNSKQFVVIADYRKDSKSLGQQYTKGVPVEVIPLAYIPIKKRIEQMGGTPIVRMGGSQKAGPIITDNGNFVFDVQFGVIEPHRVPQLENELMKIPGVVATGLFVEMAVKAFFGQKDGSVKIRMRNSQSLVHNAFNFSSSVQKDKEEKENRTTNNNANI